MKYCILHLNYNGFFDEFYLKGKSVEHLQERIERYANGALNTTKGVLFTEHINYGFLREVNPDDIPGISKKDFATINENKSYDHLELQKIKDDEWDME